MITNTPHHFIIIPHFRIRQDTEHPNQENRKVCSGGPDCPHATEYLRLVRRSPAKRSSPQDQFEISNRGTGAGMALSR